MFWNHLVIWLHILKSEGTKGPRVKSPSPLSPSDTSLHRGDEWCWFLVYSSRDVLCLYKQKHTYRPSFPSFPQMVTNCTLLCTLLFSITCWWLVHVRTYGIFSLYYSCLLFCYALYHKFVFPVFLFLNLKFL